MSAEFTATDFRAAQPQFNPWLIAATVMSATFMEVLDMSVANVALRHIAGNLAASMDESTWVLTSYLISNAVVLVATGWLIRRFERGGRRVVTSTLFSLTVVEMVAMLVFALTGPTWLAIAAPLGVFFARVLFWPVLWGFPFWPPQWWRIQRRPRPTRARRRRSTATPAGSRPAARDRAPSCPSPRRLPGSTDRCR